MKQKFFTIMAKNKKLGGFKRIVGEVEFSQMIDKDDYEIVKEKSAKKKAKKSAKKKSKKSESSKSN